MRAIREFDGANANGQPIRLSLLPGGPSRSRNPFDSAVRPARPLSERITAPGGRSRSRSPVRHTDVSGPPPDGVDRYVPGQGGRYSRSPLPSRRREGRRPGARRERGERGGGAAGREGGREAGRSGARPKKTQEELDAEMEDYWGNGAAGKENGATVEPEPAPPAAGGDVEMAE
ncbi:MAG: hypothetical protein M1818_000985 [Claussenomyces sp. TS43310]|nr:MAG: hypothetical protein M1818_000985 [Claussenomyces sp. TS43310]